MLLGENIKKARKGLGITQAQLAAQLGLAIGTVQQYELGKREPSTTQIAKIADALGVFPSDLLGWGEATRVLAEATLKGEDVPQMFPQIILEKKEPTLDDFTYALQNEAEALTEEDKELLLSMARQLADARRQTHTKE